jgi:hypothetical protein
MQLANRLRRLWTGEAEIVFEDDDELMKVQLLQVAASGLSKRTYAVGSLSTSWHGHSNSIGWHSHESSNIYGPA